MSISFRNFTAEAGFSEDFHRVRDFLVRINTKIPIPEYHFEWGRWEWAFSLEFLGGEDLGRIGVWESAGEIVALATLEDKPGSGSSSLPEREIRGWQLRTSRPKCSPAKGWKAKRKT